MPPKSMTMLGMFLGSTVGGLIPALFGVSIFSLWSLFGALVGGLFGIWLVFRIFS